MQRDCLAYERQIEEIPSTNTDKGAMYGPDDDYMYQFTDSDCLKPVINIILYWEKRKWRGEC